MVPDKLGEVSFVARELTVTSGAGNSMFSSFVVASTPVLSSRSVAVAVTLYKPGDRGVKLSSGRNHVPSP